VSGHEAHPAVRRILDPLFRFKRADGSTIQVDVIGRPVLEPGIYEWIPETTTEVPCAGYNCGCRICRVVERNRDALQDAKDDLLPDDEDES